MKTLYTIFCSLFFFYVSAAPPTVATSDAYFDINGASLHIGWTAGNGAKRIIIAKAGSPVTAVPENGTDYSENTQFGSGQEIAPGEFVIYDNAFTSFFLTGLTPATKYYFAFFEYNGTGASIEYLTSSFLVDSASTAAAPTMQATAITFSNITGTSVIATIAVGNGARRIILAREGAPVNADPADLTAYGGSTTFGSGSEVGTGNFCVYSSSGDATSIVNLKSGTEYYFAVYEFNGLGEPVYKKPPLTGSVTTRTVPTTPASNIVFTNVDGQELTLDWTSGNGLRRIIVAREGSDVTAVPADGTDYDADEVFGNGTAIAPGEYVVYDDNFHSTVVKGLDPATTYYFRIYEYDGTGNTTIYLKTLYGSANSSTAVKPTVQASALGADNITSNSLNLIWTGGNGKGVFVVAKKDEAVDITPEDLTAYIANSSFGDGDELGTGNFVLSYNLTNGLIVSNLEANTTYHFAVFEYNGLNQPLYLTPAATFSATTLAPLPVTLTEWNAVNNGIGIQLKWTTAYEENASHYNILRSTNGVNFTVIASVPAKGNSQSALNYSANDNNPPSGEVYYKLEIIDNDGQVKYSRIINLSFKVTRSFRIRTNIVTSDLQVDLPGADRKREWQIVNAKGELVKKGIVSTGNLQVNILSLPSGIYWFRLQSESNIESKPFIKR